MDVRQQDVERIVVEVLKKMMSDQPTAAATTVVAASGCDCGDFGLFDRLEDAVQAAEAAQKKISTVAMRDKIIAAIRKAGLENAKAFAEIAHNETGMGRVSDQDCQEYPRLRAYSRHRMPLPHGHFRRHGP